MTTAEKMCAVRASSLQHIPHAILLSEKDRADFIAGRCTMRVFQGTPILDYTRPWFDFPRRGAV